MNASAVGQVYHGGARRLEMRWPNHAAEPPQRLSLYEIPAGEVCSLHVHTGKAETWIVVAGTGIARIGSWQQPVSTGDALVTPPGNPHSIKNTGAGPLVFLNLVTLTGDAAVTTTELSD